MLNRLVLALVSVFALAAPLAHAGDHVTTNETIWPTQNDIAQTAGQGKGLLENQWAKQSFVFAPNNYSLTGLTVAATSGTLSITVNSGTVYIAGRHITIPAGTSVTAAASNTNFVFLKMTRDGGSLATGVSFEVNSTNAAPADSTPIATLTAGASTITATSDKRILPTTITVLTSGTSWIVPAGIARVFVELRSAGGGGGGGKGGDGGVGTPGDGTNGGNGGTTTFDTLTATGGSGGLNGAHVVSPYPFGSDGAGSVGVITTRGNGMGGGPGGAGGTTGAGTAGNYGFPGGDGGYTAGYMDLAPGTDITYAIGAAGTGGAGGAGVSGGNNGAAGTAGQLGSIIIHY